MKPSTLPLLATLTLLSTASGRADAFGVQPLQSATDPDVVRVATLNTWGLPYPVATGRRRRLPAIGELLEELAFDVAGLQEVWRGATRFLGLEQLLVPPSRYGDTGLALLTRHRTTDMVVAPFRHARGFDAWKTKSVVATRLDLSEQRSLWAVNTHLQSGGGTRDAEVRAHQIDVLVDLLGRLEGPAVVLGDFNFHDQPADRASVERLATAGLVDSAEATGETTATWDGGTYRFDRIYARSTADVRLVPVEAEVIRYRHLPRLSDHRPLRVALRWERRGED